MKSRAGPFRALPHTESWRRKRQPRETQRLARSAARLCLVLGHNVRATPELQQGARAETAATSHLTAPDADAVVEELRL